MGKLKQEEMELILLTVAKGQNKPEGREHCMVCFASVLGGLWLSTSLGVKFSV